MFPSLGVLRNFAHEYVGGLPLAECCCLTVGQVK
jgi:hypothetical protein